MSKLRMTVALLAVLAASPAYADRITLTSGRTIEGVLVQEEDSRVQFDMDGTLLWIERRHVKSLARSAPKPAPASAAVEAEAAEPVPAPASDIDVEALVKRLGSKISGERAAAAKDIVAGWPASAPAVDAALASKDETTRVEAVRLLDREELGDTRVRLRGCLKSDSPRVRMIAARVVRHRAYSDLEPELIRIMRSDSQWKVQQEALRALEVVGSRRCLQHVVAQLSIDEDASHARRYRRVLERLLGQRHGEDVDAWRDAVENVLYRGGKLAAETSARR